MKWRCKPKNAKRADLLVSATLPPNATSESALRDEYSRVTGFASQIQTWYLQDRKKKRLLSKLLRVGGIILAAAGAIYPLLIAHAPGSNAFAGYALLGMAGACYAVDRALGLSTSWARSIEAVGQVNSATASFRHDWIHLELSQDHGREDKLRLLLQIANDYEQKLIHICQLETGKWIKEFQAVNRDLELKASSDYGRATDD